MNTTHLPTLNEMADFVSGSQVFDFRVKDKTEAYDYIRRVLVGISYHALDKRDKGIVRSYLMKICNYSRAQLARLIAQHRQTGRIVRAERTQPVFEARYGSNDIAELAKLDELYERMSGQAMVVVLQREYELFGNTACERLKDISGSHLYNLRQTNTYKRVNTTYTKTKPSVVKLGERIKPEPKGRPGFLRVDTEHQGDKDGEKGVYHINLVDEVTQWETVIWVVDIVVKPFIC